MLTGVCSSCVVWQGFFERYTRLLMDTSPEFPIHFLKIYSRGGAWVEGWSSRTHPSQAGVVSSPLVTVGGSSSREATRGCVRSTGGRAAGHLPQPGAAPQCPAARAGPVAT